MNTVWMVTKSLPTTIRVNSNPFLTDFLWTWFGRLANPTYPGRSGLTNCTHRQRLYNQNCKQRRFTVWTVHTVCQQRPLWSLFYISFRRVNRYVGASTVPYSLASVAPGYDPSVRQSALRWLFKSSKVVGCNYFPPGLQSPSQLKNVTVLRPVPSYTAWWQRSIGVNNLPEVVMQLCPSKYRTHDLLIASPTLYPMPMCHLPPTEVYEQVSQRHDWLCLAGSGVTSYVSM